MSARLGGPLPVRRVPRRAARRRPDEFAPRRSPSSPSARASTCVLPTSPRPRCSPLARGREHFDDAVAGAVARGDRALQRQVADRRAPPRSPASPRPRRTSCAAPDEFRAAAERARLPRRRRLHEAARPPRARAASACSPPNVDRRYALLEARPGPLPLRGRRGARRDRRGRLPAAARDGARDGHGAHGRRHLPRRPARARPRQDARGDARRPRHVLRDGRPARPRRRRRAACAPSSVSTGSVNVQFIGDHLLEVNPRISTIVYQEDLNLPYLAVRHAVGETRRGRARGRSHARRAPTRRALRYYDQVEFDEEWLSRAPRSGAAGRLAGAPVARLRARHGRLALRVAAPAAASTRTTCSRATTGGRDPDRLVAVGATIAQLGMVNSLFRFALEREGEARWRVVRTAHRRSSPCSARSSPSAWRCSRRSSRQAAARVGPGVALARLVRGPLDRPRLRADGRPLPRRAAAAALPR